MDSRSIPEVIEPLNDPENDVNTNAHDRALVSFNPPLSKDDALLLELTAQNQLFMNSMSSSEFSTPALQLMAQKNALRKHMYPRKSIDLLPSKTKTDLLWLIECKDYSHVPPAKLDELQSYISTILAGSVEGLSILKLIENNIPLNSSNRSNISEMLVNHEINSAADGKISPLKFKFLSYAIKSICPSESPFTYYVPQVGKAAPSGKLYQKYVVKKRRYQKFGLMCSSASRTSSSDAESSLLNETVTEPESAASVAELENTASVAEPENAALTEEILHAEDWLKAGVEPFELVAEKWRLTSKKRVSKLRTSKEEIEQIFARLPALGESFGYQLIEIDFESRYPDKTRSLLSTWPTLVDNIITYSQKKYSIKKLVCSDIPDFFNLHNKSAEEKSFYALCLLPYLFSLSSADKKLRYSRKDIKDNFLLHIKSPAELHVELASRTSALTSAGEAVQPVPVVTGLDAKSLNAYVEVNNRMYCLRSPLQAVDICFKLFSALNTPYPRPAHLVWYFVQRYIFRIVYPQDKVKPELETLAVELGLI